MAKPSVTIMRELSDLTNPDLLRAAMELSSIKMRVRPGPVSKMLKGGPIGMTTLALGMALQGVIVGGGAALGDWWMMGLGAFGTAVLMYCVVKELKIVRRQMQAAGISSVMHALLATRAFDDGKLAEIKANGLEIVL